ncbi:MAG: adenosylcobinamide-phosphate synthase CbiB [Hyphomicrobiaceae bacterium]
MSMAVVLLVALVIEAAVGWPDRLHRTIGHPVTWMGRLIDFLDQRCNRAEASGLTRRLYGALTAMLVIGLAAFVAWVVAWLLPSGLLGVVIGGALAWPLMAARSMHDHVAAVARPLARNDLFQAREAVSTIVGRDSDRLDTAGVSRAALESLAENTSDGIVAPIFWGLLLGLPGIAAYKAVNTLDSMIGHRTPRHEMFGWAAARIDDVANFVPARVTGAMFCIVSGRFQSALACMIQYAGRHRSPNAGWPEAAMAGALGVRLSGPRAYAGGASNEPWLNAEARDADVADLDRGLALFVRAMLLLAACLAIVAVVGVVWQ